MARLLAPLALLGLLVVAGLLMAGCASAPVVERRDASVTLSGELLPSGQGR